MTPPSARPAADEDDDALRPPPRDPAALRRLLAQDIEEASVEVKNARLASNVAAAQAWADVLANVGSAYRDITEAEATMSRADLEA